MLDQRGAKEKGYITLKEAAEIANYTPDYVGQLIRGGKIKGEQVYANVAWVTTHGEVEAYMKDKNRTVSEEESSAFFVMFHQVSSYFLYTLIALCAVALLFMQYVLYVSIDAGLDKTYLSQAENNETQSHTGVTVSSR